MSDRDLRRGLRAKLRQLADDGDQLDLLVGDCAYEQWHRLLFARFLSENDLLIHPQYRGPVTLAECDELAADLGEPDGWGVAGRFAAEILPGIFRLDDPCAQLRLAPEGRLELEEIVASLPAEIFAADDALGWVYQYWQKEKKDEVNDSERKIGGADLGPVTQLFTENYMVRFLLENSLGAWWASRHPDSPLVKTWDYLRFDENRSSAAGSFDGWPKTVAEVTVMDPCCGSGHFLVEAFRMLWQMRAEEEGLAPVAAQDAVLRDNLFGLELDARCVQIAMFAVALTAWKAGGGWRELLVPHIACSGIPVKAPADEWTALGGDDPNLENALVRLHILFRDADTLGSLIDPKRAVEISDSTGLQKTLEDVDWEKTAPFLKKALASEDPDPATAVLGAEAEGIARAASLLSSRFTLIVTNVPFLARGRQSAVLADYLGRCHPSGKADLATGMLDRMRNLLARSGCLAAVSPIQWLFLNSYRSFRSELLTTQTFRMIVRLGPRAFTGISGEVASAALALVQARAPMTASSFLHADLTAEPGPEDKAKGLRVGVFKSLDQSTQASNPSSIVSPAYEDSGGLLADYADGYAGIQTGDLPRFVRFFWEVDTVDGQEWAYYQGTVDESCDSGGLEKILLWESGGGSLHKFVADRLGGSTGAWIRGVHCVGKAGVSVSQMGMLPVTLYSGQLFDPNNAVILPRAERDLPAVWQYCRSKQFAADVRAIDQSLKVTNQTLVNVPFDMEHWRKVAEEADPLPPPWSDDPTQWVFEGRPEAATEPLQVGVCRLLGYRWPEQPDDDLVELADSDGIACLPSVLGEQTAGTRVQEVLARAFGRTWSPARAAALLAKSGSRKKDLESWLRDEFFKAHCQVFKSRPFIWHVWDGRKDGFAALVNYHRLDRPTLERLTYTYLGDWIERQTAGAREDLAGAEERLVAARDLQRRLELILAGETPYDIYVRWKSLAEQPIGWDPDVNDGVRLNVRPFVEAGVLRSKFNVKWDKDRGKNLDGSGRLNNFHFTTAQKQGARSGGPA